MLLGLQGGADSESFDRHHARGWDWVFVGDAYPGRMTDREVVQKDKLVEKMSVRQFSLKLCHLKATNSLHQHTDGAGTFSAM